MPCFLKFDIQRSHASWVEVNELWGSRYGHATSHGNVTALMTSASGKILARTLFLALDWPPISRDIPPRHYGSRADCRLIAKLCNRMKDRSRSYPVRAIASKFVAYKEDDVKSPIRGAWARAGGDFDEQVRGAPVRGAKPYLCRQFGFPSSAGIALAVHLASSRDAPKIYPGCQDRSIIRPRRTRSGT